jgi:GAF domain-containing protein
LLSVDRSSVWYVADDGRALVCDTVQQRSQRRRAPGAAGVAPAKDGPTPGDRLSADEHPAYFAALGEAGPIIADDARNDARTASLCVRRAGAQRLASKLDVPVFVGGQLIAVLCIDQLGTPRPWLPEEETFVLSIANLVQLAYERQRPIAADAALRASEARFRSLTELSSDWYWEQDAELRFSLIGGCSSVVSAGAPLSLIGKRRWESLAFAFDPEALAEHQALLAAHQPFRDFEY